MTAIETITAPALLPVTAAELNAYLRANQDATSEQTLLEELIASATNLFESECNRPVLATRYRQTLGNWPNPVMLGRGNVTTIHDVRRYLDNAGTTEAVIQWTPSLNLHPQRLILGKVPVEVPDIGAVGYVEYTAGWANVAAVPKEVLLAIKLLAAHWYQNRAAFTEKNLSELPLGWKNATAKFRLRMQGTWGQG